jgi:hypothetical protein
MSVMRFIYMCEFLLGLKWLAWVVRANTLEALAGESGVAKRQGLRAALFGGCPLQREDPKPAGLTALRAARAKPLRFSPSIGHRWLSLLPIGMFIACSAAYLEFSFMTFCGPEIALLDGHPMDLSIRLPLEYC